MDDRAHPQGGVRHRAGRLLVPPAVPRELHLPDEPSVEEARKLFVMLELALPGSFTDRDIADVIRKAIRPKNPYW